jgi:F-type H+-transporting ATPase subunit c
MILTTMILQVAAGAALGKAGAALGAAIAAIAAAFGIGKIGKSTMEAIARQPESAGNLRTSMIIAAGMVEGAALFAIIVALLAIVIN